MNSFLLLAIGFLLGMVCTAGLTNRAGKSTEAASTIPDSREQVIAGVLLHRARRSRQLAELERSINDRAEQRLRRLDGVGWPEGRL